MAINITNPIVIPGSPDKIADKVWIVDFYVNAKFGVELPVSAYFNVAPFISETGEVVKEEMITLELNDVLGEAEKNLALGQAVYSIFSAVEFLCKEKGIFGMIPDPKPLQILSHPQSQVMSIADAVTMSIDSTGRPINYQWYKDDAEIQNSEFISGSTTNTLTISNLTMMNSGSYNVKIYNDLEEIMSEYAILTILPA